MADNADLGIDHLTVAEVISGDGSTTVYRAYDETLQREVAVRVLHNRPASDREQRRIDLEIEAYWEMSYTVGTPQFLSRGWTEDGRLYLVMEFFPGTTLDDWLEFRDSLDWREVADLALSLLTTIDFLHQNNVIHGDLKPASILISQDGDPKIIDFGAMLWSSDSTWSGQAVDTFVAPEVPIKNQFFASDRSVAGDLYSMGALLYYLLTGHGPSRQFSEPDVQGGEYELSVPASLRNLVQRALAETPSERPQSASEFAAELREIILAESGGATENAETGGTAVALYVGPERKLISVRNSQLVTIGRSPDSQLQLTDPTVSRRHMTLRIGDTEDGATVTVRDFSRRGTFVNGRRIQEATPVNTGDLIQVGRTSIEVGTISSRDLTKERPFRDRSYLASLLASPPDRRGRHESLAGKESIDSWTLAGAITSEYGDRFDSRTRLRDWIDKGTSNGPPELSDSERAIAIARLLDLTQSETNDLLSSLGLGSVGELSASQLPRDIQRWLQTHQDDAADSTGEGPPSSGGEPSFESAEATVARLLTAAQPFDYLDERHSVLLAEVVAELSERADLGAEGDRS